MATNNALLAQRLREPRQVSLFAPKDKDEKDKTETFPNTGNTMDLLAALRGDNSGSSNSGSSPGGSNALDIMRMRNMTGNGSTAGGASNLSFGQEGAFTGQQGAGWSGGSFTPAATGLGGGLMAVPGGAGFGTASGGAAFEAGVMPTFGGLSNAAVGTGAGASGGSAGGGAAAGGAGLGVAGAGFLGLAAIPILGLMAGLANQEKDRQEAKTERARLSSLTPEQRREEDIKDQQKQERILAEQQERQRQIDERRNMARLLSGNSAYYGD